MIKKKFVLSLTALLIFQSFFLSSCGVKIPGQAKAKVLNSASIPTYVFYYAKWCGFCHKMAPLVSQAAEKFENKIFFYYVDIDSEEGKQFTKKYRPKGRGVPYAQFYDGKGNYIKDKIGLISYEQLENSLKTLL